MTISRLGVLASIATALVSGTAAADPFFFSTGNPDGRIATATRPDTPGSFEIESADDFVLTSPTTLTGASFTGLFVPPLGSTTIGSPTDVVVEIYGVFPADSNVGRTSGPPTFSTNQVPTRVNSPSDVALDSRDSADHDLNFHTRVLSTSFTAQA